MAEKKKNESLYSQIVEKGDSVLKAMGFDRQMRADQRAFESAYDDLLGKQDKLEDEKQEFYKSVGKYSDKLSKHLERAWAKRDIDDSIEMLKSEYKLIFGKAFEVRN